MKYFIVEGILKSQDEVKDDIMKVHMTYTQKAMDSGLILMSGLKSNMSGGIFIMKAGSIEEVEEYLAKEPFKVNGIQDYKVTGFMPHYFNKSPDKWFN